jgi:hypothetical protein
MGSNVLSSFSRGVLYVQCMRSSQMDVNVWYGGWVTACHEIVLLLNVVAVFYCCRSVQYDDRAASHAGDRGDVVNSDLDRAMMRSDSL